MPFLDIPFAVLEKVVELFYYGEVRVLTVLKVKLFKALDLLQVDDVDRPAPSAPSAPKKSTDDGPINGNFK